MNNPSTPANPLGVAAVALQRHIPALGCGFDVKTIFGNFTVSAAEVRMHPAMWSALIEILKARVLDLTIEIVNGEIARAANGEGGVA